MTIRDGASLELAQALMRDLTQFRGVLWHGDIELCRLR